MYFFHVVLSAGNSYNLNCCIVCAKTLMRAEPNRVGAAYWVGQWGLELAIAQRGSNRVWRRFLLACD